MKASELVTTPEVISTGLDLVDSALGVGGLPLTKLSEIAGPSGIGKSTLAMQIVASAQKAGHPCFWADSELSMDAFSVEYAKGMGVNTSELEVERQTKDAETLLDDMQKWAMENERGLMVLDSIGNLSPREEQEKGAEGRSIGGQARIIGAFCRRISPILVQNNHALLVLNHIFTSVGPMPSVQASGGLKLGYTKSVSIFLKKKFGKAPKRDSTGLHTIAFVEGEVKKNKCAPTVGTKFELEFVPGHGFSNQKTEPRKRSNV